MGTEVLLAGVRVGCLKTKYETCLGMEIVLQIYFKKIAAEKSEPREVYK